MTMPSHVAVGGSPGRARRLRPADVDATTACTTVKLAPVTLAVVEAFARPAEVASNVRRMLGAVHAWLRGEGIERAGHDHVLYDHLSGDEMRVRAGVPVAGRFAAEGRVCCVELAGGKAARVTHRGARGSLPAAHGRLREWCARNALQLAGESWEVTGDRGDGAWPLVTEVYLRLASDVPPRAAFPLGDSPALSPPPLGARAR